RCAAVPRRARRRGRRAHAGRLAFAALDPLHRRDGALGRDQPLRDDRDHALRLLAVTEETERADRRARIAIAAIIAVGVVLRFLVLPAKGFPSDVATFQAWASRPAPVRTGDRSMPWGPCRSCSR